MLAGRSCLGSGMASYLEYRCQYENRHPTAFLKNMVAFLKSSTQRTPVSWANHLLLKLVRLHC